MYVQSSNDVNASKLMDRHVYFDCAVWCMLGWVLSRIWPVPWSRNRINDARRTTERCVEVINCDIVLVARLRV